MTENRSRFVLLCQQALACAVVVAVAAPAAGIVTLDFVAPPSVAPVVAPGSSSPAPEVSEVEVAPVEPKVTEVAIDNKAGTESSAAQTDGRTGGPAARLASAEPVDPAQEAAVSVPTTVEGYATVGVTWEDADVEFEDGEIAVAVRSRTAGEWGDWEDVPFEADGGPDPGSEEALNAREGTNPLVVGEVDEVQVKVLSGGKPLPDDLRLSVIDPGAPVETTTEAPAIDTARLSSADVVGDPLPSGEPTAPAEPTDPDVELVGTPADVTPKPKIYSRAQWGADERLRDKSSLRYGEVHAGFVHHTVNANGYTEAQVPSILRGIYAYHTQSRGWSDVGYNFLVDRFGRIWEGRYGGVDRAAVGAHTLGYNEYAFAMSAIGNFDTTQPGDAMVRAYGALFAWKLSLHGISASSTRQWVYNKWMPAVNGHRDVGQTACPGRYLYAKLSTIRQLAAAGQRPFTSRQKDTDLAGSRWPDLVVRDAVTQKALVVRTGGQVGFAAPRTAATGFAGMDLIVAPGDLNGDKRPDLLARDATTKATGFYPGDGAGRFGTATRSMTRFASHDLLVAAGDLTGDGRNDVLGRKAGSTALLLHPGRGTGSFGQTKVLAADWSAYETTASAGDLNGDGKDDLVVRQGSTLLLVPGVGQAALGTPVALPGRWAGFDVVAGMGDLTNDGRADLVARARKSQQTYIYPGDGAGGLGTRFGPFPTFAGVSFLAPAGPVFGTASNDLVGRNAKGALVSFANRGGAAIEGTAPAGVSLSDTNLVLNAGDWNGDGHGDLMTRQASTGDLVFRAGNGNGGFAAPVVASKGWGRVGLIAAVGDLTGDGYPDLMGQPAGSAMRIYPSNGGTGFRTSYVARSAITATKQVGVGLWNADGSPDSLLRKSDGSLVLYPGNGPGGLTTPSSVPTKTSGYDWLLGAGDVDGDGRADVLARDKANGRLWLLPGASTGFGPRRFVADGFSKYDLATS